MTYNTTTQFMLIDFRRFLSFWVILLSKRVKTFSLQLVCVNAVYKCLTDSAVMRLEWRTKLFSLQLVCVNAVYKPLTPSSVIWF